MFRNRWVYLAARKCLGLFIAIDRTVRVTASLDREASDYELLHRGLRYLSRWCRIVTWLGRYGRYGSYVRNKGHRGIERSEMASNWTGRSWHYERHKRTLTERSKAVNYDETLLPRDATDDRCDPMTDGFDRWVTGDWYVLRGTLSLFFAKVTGLDKASKCTISRNNASNVVSWATKQVAMPQSTVHKMVQRIRQTDQQK